MIGRRVVVTGIGILSPLGVGKKVSWDRLIQGESGIGKITNFDAANFACTIAGEINWENRRAEVLASAMSLVDQRKVDPFINFAMVAADEAIEDSGFAVDDSNRHRCGVVVGSGIGGLDGIASTAILMNERGPRRISPHFVPGRLTNLASGYVSIKHGFTGVNHSVTTACATGTHAIGDAARMIALDDADVILAGGSEAAVVPIGVAGFLSCRALTTNFNDTPEQASRPFDRNRSGFVISEGAAVLLLEELGHAKARGANIYCEVIGYGMGGDAYHATAPSPDGRGAENAMRAALKSAKLNSEEIDYINAHGTSTPIGDVVELEAIGRVFSNSSKKLAVSSVKSAVGHSLGAAGGIEAAFSALAICNNVAPPTLNLDDPECDTEFDLVPHEAKEMKINTVLSNSFGFGGTNSCLVFKGYDL